MAGVLCQERNPVSTFRYAARDTFLTDLFQGGASYGTLNNARSAISLISQTDITSNKLISRFFKGVFRMRPTQPRCQFTWDVQKVISLLESWWPLDRIPLEQLTWRLAMLLALASGQRVQTLAAISLTNLRWQEGRGCQIIFTELLKTRPGVAPLVLWFPDFPDQPRVCVPTTIRRYLRETQGLRRGNNQLLLCTRKPFGPASRDTIARWLRTTLTKAGISSDYAGHSVRHAATSAAARRGVDWNSIRKVASWSAQSRVFASHYNRPLESQSFAASVLTGQDP